MNLRQKKKTANPINPTEKPIKPTQPQHQHNFDYNVSVVTKPTSTSACVERYTYSCDEYRDESLSATNHAWHHHNNEKGHYKDITKDAYKYHTICNQCGKDFGPGEAGANTAVEHLNDKGHNYCAERRKVETTIVSKEWVVDEPAYNQCNKCGTRK